MDVHDRRDSEIHGYDDDDNNTSCTVITIISRLFQKKSGRRREVTICMKALFFSLSLSTHRVSNLLDTVWSEGPNVHRLRS